MALLIVQYKRYPSLSRDTSAKILDIIADAKDNKPIFIRKVKDALGFAMDFLFCEWMYVIDLDANKQEVYKGSALVSDSEAARSRFVFLATRESTGCRRMQFRICWWRLILISSLRSRIL
jgi:hypothetical protein